MRIFLILSILNTYLLSLCYSLKHLDVYHAPSIDNANTIQFFILEATFPYNAPESLRYIYSYY